MARKKNRFKLRDLRDAATQVRRLAPYVLPYWPRFLLYFLSLLLYNACMAGRVFVLEPFLRVVSKIDHNVAITRDESGVDTLLADWGGALGIAGILLAAGAGMAIGTLGKQYNMNWLMFRSRVDVQRDMIVRLMGQPISFFDKMRKGELLSRVTNDLTGVQKTFHITFNDLVAHPVSIAMLLGGMLITSPALSLAALVMPVVLLPVIVFANKIKKLSRRSFESQAELSNFFHQFFEGVRVVKAFGMEKQQERELDRTALGFFQKSVRVGKYKGVSRALVEFVLALVLAGALFAGLSLLSLESFAESFDFATFAQFMAFLILLYDPVRKFSHTLNNMSEAMGANERVFELMDRKPDLQDLPDAVEAKPFANEIVVEHVSFEYDIGRPVLHDVSFTARKGSMTAFVGATGAGKTTLLDLIPRFYAPTSGRVLVDGVDLATIKHQSWLSQIAIVSQETFLFNTSVRENLLAADPNASDENLIDALKAANIWEETQALEHGLETILGDRGVNLSGGQRQRLAIARAFLKRAPILLLDEATSALDSATERKVQEAIDRLIEGATVFAIAHRLSTISHADQILVLDQGRIIETGTHHELLARNGRYTLLYDTQRRSGRMSTAPAAPGGDAAAAPSAGSGGAADAGDA